MKVEDLKNYIQKFNLVSNVNTMRKDDLIKTYKSLQEYDETKNNYDYWHYTFTNKKTGEKTNITVNEEQYRVITSDIKNHIRIIACAGSGKTTTIICRIKYLIDKGVNPETIMLTTFNVDAAKNMKKKIKQLFGFMPKIIIGTIDSIACRYYYKYFKCDYYVSVSEYGSEFLKFLKSNNGNLILNSISYLFFDEFQDANTVQYEIIKVFYKHGSKVTVIGDDAQNIYQFRGSNVKFIIDFDKDIKNLETYKLVNNYRSTPEIITLANSSINNNENQIKKAMIANNISINYKPIVTYHDNMYIEIQFIITKIVDLIKNHGVKLDDIAILSRTNFPLKKLEEKIERHNVQKNTIANKETIKYISLISDDTANAKAKTKADHLTILSIHKSKGLEWKVVFLMACDDNNFPCDKDKLSIEEERRLFYVAVTRPKQQLYISFHGKRFGENPDNNTFVSRFIQEVPREYYKFTNFHTRFYKLSTKCKNHWEEAVTKIIKMFNETDLTHLREMGIIPSVNPSEITIHNEYKLNKIIKDNGWQMDFGEFIDRYISRLIGDNNEMSDGRIDRCANRVIHPCILNNFDFLIFLKYADNFKLNVMKINKDTPIDLYINILNENPNRLTELININDMGIIMTILNKMMAIHRQFDIPMKYIIVTTEKKLPTEFVETMVAAYEKYRSKNLDTDSIIKEIYQISLCGMVCSDRNRLLYNQIAYNCFTQDNTELFSDIKKYVSGIKDNNLQCKKYVFNMKYVICGEIDLLDITHEKIIDFKCSEASGFQMEWCVQLLAYVALMRLNKHEKIENIHTKVNQIEIYNALKGVIYTVDITNWNKEKELLEYMDYVRTRQILRNDISQDNILDDLKTKNQIILDECSEKIGKNNLRNILDANDWFIKENLKYYDQIEDINKKKHLLDMFKSYYNDHKKIALSQGHTNELLYEISKLFDFKYIVIDTETNGLPKMNKGQVVPFTKLHAYDSARIVQLSWAVYNAKDELIKTGDFVIKPDKFTISAAISKIHGITHDMAETKGVNISLALDNLMKDLNDVNFIVCHNIMFDVNVIKSELLRLIRNKDIQLINSKKTFCTLECTRAALKSKRLVKNSKLGTVYRYYFGEEIENAHNSLYDVLNTGKVFTEMRKRNLFII